MIKKEIYPKTERMQCNGTLIHVTEKLDGSNLTILKKDDVLYIAQRSFIFKYDELDDVKDKLYKGLYQWLKDNFVSLNDLNEGSAICGEWLGMGQIKYPDFDKKFYMFAKANIGDDWMLNKINYDHNLFVYPFQSQIIPECIDIVPDVTILKDIPTKKSMDIIYLEYCKKVDRKVEGFILNQNNNITKYVRMKNGKLSEHFDRGV